MPRPTEDDYDDQPPEDRPPRRKRDDDDDGDSDKQSWVEKQLLNTNFALLIFFALCCNSCFFLPLIFGIVGLVTSKNPDAKQRALIMTIISAVVIVLGVIAQVISMATQAGRAGIR